MRMKGAILICVLALGGVLTIDISASYGTEVLRVGHIVSRESSVGKGVERFAELVESKTMGKLVIKVFPRSQLGGPKVLLDLVIKGGLALAVVPTRVLTTRIEKAMVLELPFLFLSYNEADKFLEGNVGKAILRLLSEAGVLGLCYFEHGLVGIASRVRAIYKVEDYRGLRIRIGSPQFVSDSVELLGASPITLPVEDVYFALQRGVADATLTTVTDFSHFKYNEILSYLSLTNHFYVSQILIVNRQRYDQLPLELRESLSQAASEASKYQRKLSRTGEEKILNHMEESGVKIVRGPDRLSMRKAVSPIYEEAKRLLDCSQCKKFPWCCIW